LASPYDFSSMTALICFEAAARKLSFRRAAEEMNVTPAAISHQIKALEADLDCRLFVRRSRGVELTEKGAYLLVVIQRGFEGITDAITKVRDRPEKVDVTIQATTAVSSLWLTPKISAFWKAHPKATVSQTVNDVPGSIHRCDLSIHYGSDQSTGEATVLPLFKDNIVALGSPEYVARHPIGSVRDLQDAPLIHFESEETDWTRWDDWFHALGHQSPHGQGLRVNNYMIALQAAQDGMGAVLGWDGLAGKLMREGRLVQLVPESLPSPVPFCLKVHARASPKARLFADWVAAHCLGTTN